ncbi:MAG: C10 family peptidase [Bacteroidaceae bacterium]|nr:C10 family peptidase [Bacteroidaceae bacterium]
MKLRALLYIYVFFTLHFYVYAQQRTVEQAQQIAADMMGTTSDELISVTVASQAKARAGGAIPSFYIFNNKQEGYVIVSSDEKFKTILGYNKTGTFDPNNMPDGLSYWLQFIREEIQAAISSSQSPKGDNLSDNYYPVLSPKALRDNRRSEGLGLLSAHWAQGIPFNNQIPVSYTEDPNTYGGHAAVGCVATALGEIMNYWQYPTQGQGGTHTNTHHSNATVNFSTQTYDWNKIKDNYGYYLNDEGRTMKTAYADEEANEAAKLCYHIGVAVDMAWNADGKGTSTATDGKALRALTHYFGYNKYAYLQQRRTLSTEAFTALLLSELNAGRPVPYSGISTETGTRIGHYFVLDGYDAATRLFHINWGWRGMYNGYYAISALEPGTSGIGAGTGSYNYDQNALIGVQPTEKYFEYAPAYSASSFTVETPTFERGGGINNCARVKAHGLVCHDASFSGTFGLALYNTAGQYETGKFYTLDEFQDGVVYDYITFDTNPFNKIIPFGTHTMRLVARADDGTIYPIHATYGQSESWQVVVTAGTNSRDPGTVKITAIPPTIDPTNDIEGVIADAPVPVRTEYYTLSGIRIQAPRADILIQKDLFSDGSIKTKVIKSLR